MPTSVRFRWRGLRTIKSFARIGSEGYLKKPQALMACLLFILGSADVAAQIRTQALPVSKATAKEASKIFSKEFRSKDERQRLAAVARLTPMKHKIVVKCLAKALKDRSVAVRAAAARRLGMQAPKEASKYLHAALNACKSSAKPKLTLALLEGLQGLRMGPDLKLVKKRFDAWPKEVQREIFRSLKYLRTKDTLKFMASRMGEPKPGNVDSPTNPPASYWKERVIGWRFWIVDLHDSVFSLTGEYLDEPQDLKKWLRKGKIKPLQDKTPKKS